MNKLKSVKDCPRTNCRFHFPQFEVLNPVEWLSRLEEIVSQSGTPEDEKVLYRQSIELLKQKNLEATIQAIEISSEKYGYECYLDLLGLPVIYNHCCR